NKGAATLYEISLLKHAPVASRQAAFAFATLLIYLAFSKDRFISRMFLFTLLPAEYLLLLWTNYTLPEFLVKRFFSGTRAVRTLLIGPAESAENVRPWLERKERFGFNTVGILSDDPLAELGTRFRFLGKLADIEKVIAQQKVTQVIVLNFLLTPGHHRALIEKVEALGVRVLIPSNEQELLQRKVTFLDDDGMRFIGLHEEPLENPLNIGLKRLVDVCVALPVIVFVLPCLCALVWLLHRLQSPGPLFHRQTRAGLQNREFTIIKFRTMHEGNAEIERQATQNDERIFPAGKWLRRLGFDEFPQFLNVLRGEMSVVGPRPHLTKHNEQFARVMAGYHLRAFVKPGITGLAQVRGFHGEAHTVEDIQARLQSDMVYLENWSTPLDVAIILRTAWQILFPLKNAPAALAATREAGPIPVRLAETQPAIIGK
ncbi:MAG TPA: exopolysaccharide biosynthesis polyprenyl glycosylphosphotransferase, partial [Chthoniobacteraceae bacterium]|nr:exopolysaccharide biosynthesis polyprenyl glycosylphosphotransferase [Chthoniobacteraceae bacterium]